MNKTKLPSPKTVRKARICSQCHVPMDFLDVLEGTPIPAGMHRSRQECLQEQTAYALSLRTKLDDANNSLAVLQREFTHKAAQTSNQIRDLEQRMDALERPSSRPAEPGSQPSSQGQVEEKNPRPNAPADRPSSARDGRRGKGTG